MEPRRREARDDLESARRHYVRQLALLRATTANTEKTRCCASTTKDDRTGELLHRRDCPVLEATCV